jgi:plastocyanin
MLTEPAKVFLPLTVLGVVLVVFYGGLTGDHAGITLFFALATVAFYAGVAVTTARENEVATAVSDDAGPPELRPAPPSRLPGGPGWPIVAALAGGLIVLSFLAGVGFAVPGLALAVVAAVGWMASTSADRTGRTANLLPLGIPVVGLFAIGSLMFFMSRILLAVPEQASTFIALAVAALILAVASFVAVKPSMSTRAVMVGLVVGGLLLTSGGLVAAAVGQRDIEKHGAHAGAETLEIEADDLTFNRKEFELHANQPAVIEFTNEEVQPHNVAIYISEEATQVIFQGDVIVGPMTTEYRFTAPGPGNYFFRCDIHPNMKGAVHVA